MSQVPMGRNVHRHLEGLDPLTRGQEFLLELWQTKGVPLPEVWSKRQDVACQRGPSMTRILKGRSFTAGDKKPVASEEIMTDLKFNVFKFNNRNKPEDKRQIVIVTNFSEFGCESIALMYCIPRVLQMYPGAYIIAVGWHGREYLYRHLVDEFWEIKEEYQWLREYSRAFISESKNIARLEKSLGEHGQVLSGRILDTFVLGTVVEVANISGATGNGSILVKNVAAKTLSDPCSETLSGTVKMPFRFPNRKTVSSKSCKRSTPNC
jgi:hypothetical protein